MRTATTSQEQSVTPTPMAGKCQSGPWFEVRIARLDGLKRVLKRELPDVKHTHRIEALARGLGWSSYHTMQADVYDYTLKAAMDGAAFTEFLEFLGYSDVDPAILERVLRRFLREVPEGDPMPTAADLEPEFEEEDVTDIFFHR